MFHVLEVVDSRFIIFSLVLLSQSIQVRGLSYRSGLEPQSFWYENDKSIPTECTVSLYDYNFQKSNIYSSLLVTVLETSLLFDTNNPREISLNNKNWKNASLLKSVRSSKYEDFCVFNLIIAFTFPHPQGSVAENPPLGSFAYPLWADRNRGNPFSTFVFLWTLSDCPQPLNWNSLRRENGRMFSIVVDSDTEKKFILKRYFVCLSCEKDAMLWDQALSEQIPSQKHLQGQTVTVSDVYDDPKDRRYCTGSLSNVAKYCWMGHRVVENLALIHNFTVVYQPPNKFAVADSVIFRESAHSTLDSGPEKAYYFRATQEQYLMYCDQSHNSLVDGVEIWLSPFQYEVWIILCTSWTLAHAAGWTSSQMKKTSGLRFSKSMKLLSNFIALSSLARIILTICYESSITSLVMVPFDTRVFADVGQLLDDSVGYKIYYMQAEDHPLQPTIKEMYSGPLSKVGLDVEENHIENYFLTETDQKYANYWTNFQRHVQTKPVATANWKMYVPWDLHKYEEVTGRKCHAVKQALSEENSYWLFWWHFKQELKRTLAVFVQSGVVGWWDTNGLYWDGLHNHRVSKNMEKYVEFTSTSLGHKVSLIFFLLGWGLLAGLLTLGLEHATYAVFARINGSGKVQPFSDSKLK